MPSIMIHVQKSCDPIKENIFETSSGVSWGLKAIFLIDHFLTSKLNISQEFFFLNILIFSLNNFLEIRKFFFYYLTPAILTLFCKFSYLPRNKIIRNCIRYTNKKKWVFLLNTLNVDNSF